MEPKKNNNLTIDLIVTAIMATVLVIFTYNTLPILIFLYPVSFIALGLRYDIKYNALAMTMSGLVLMALFGALPTILIMLLFFPLSLCLNYMIKCNSDKKEIFAAGIFVFFIALLVVLNLSTKIVDKDILANLDTQIREAISKDLLSLEGKTLTKTEVNNIEDKIFYLYEYIRVILPAIYLIFSTAVVYFNYFLSTNKYNKNRSKDRVEVFHFRDIVLPGNPILGSFMMMILAGILRYIGVPKAEAILLNIVTVIVFMFSLQGISLFNYLMYKRSRSKFFRVLLTILVIFVIPVGPIFTFIGALEAVLGLREKLDKMNK